MRTVLFGLFLFSIACFTSGCAILSTAVAAGIAYGISQVSK